MLVRLLESIISLTRVSNLASRVNHQVVKSKLSKLDGVAGTQAVLESCGVASKSMSHGLTTVHSHIKTARVVISLTTVL
jgi:hypothetical protein